MKKFKHLFIGILIGAFIFSMTPISATVQQFILTKSDYKLFISGREYINKSLPILNYTGVVYAPLGNIIRLLGDTYTVDAKAKKINLTQTTPVPTSKPSPLPTLTPTATPMPTLTPTPTPTPSPTPVPTQTPTPTPSMTPTPTPTVDMNNDENIEVIVYITKTGEKYHRSGCRYLSKSRIPISLENAKKQGYSPCSVCNPPR